MKRRIARAKRGNMTMSVRGTHECAAPAEATGASVLARATAAWACTPPRVPEIAGDVASRKAAERRNLFRPSRSSGIAPAGPGRRRAIREEIIGHRMSLLLGLARSGKGFRQREFALAMLHKPARQHGGRIFLHPLIEQSRNLLAQVGGVAEPGKFVALQAVARSREEKLPRRLGFVARHGGLLRKGSESV